jgi:flagellar M-ring protein FliF
LPSQNAASAPEANFLIEAKDERDEFLEALAARKDKSPQRHLQRLVDFDEEHAAAILKQWIRQGAGA